MSLLQHMLKAAEADPILKDLVIPYETLNTNLQCECHSKSTLSQSLGKCICAVRPTNQNGTNPLVGHPTSSAKINKCPVAPHRYGNTAGENAPANTDRTKMQDMMLR